MQSENSGSHRSQRSHSDKDYPEIRPAVKSEYAVGEKEYPNEAKSLQQLIKLEGVPRRDGDGVDYQIHKGTLTVQNNFITGSVKMRGESNGAYPTDYLSLIDSIFGSEPNTIEVCSRTVKGLNQGGNVFTVDLNADFKPDLVADAQDLTQISSNKYSRWRADPPYNGNTASKMYNTELSNVNKLLKEGSRVVKEGSLLFLLYSSHTPSRIADLKRIGYLTISVVPNRETRILNIYLKLSRYVKCRNCDYQCEPYLMKIHLANKHGTVQQLEIRTPVKSEPEGVTIPVRIRNDIDTSGFGFGCISCGKWFYHVDICKWVRNPEDGRWYNIINISKLPKTVQCPQCKSYSQVNVIQKDDRRIIQVKKVEEMTKQR
jgi:hypothetical protein